MRQPHPHRRLARIAGAAVLAALLWQPLAQAADSGGASSSAKKSTDVKLESIPGSSAKRVTLSAKANERLGIETGKVGEAPIVRKQMVGGLVIPPLDKPPEQKPPFGSFGGFGAAPAPQPAAGGAVTLRQIATAPAAQPTAAAAPVAGDAWVLVTLSPGEWERIAKDKPARLLPLATRDKTASEVLAQPSGIAPVENVKRSMLTLYYVVPGKDHGLQLNKRMRVELQLVGDADKHKVVPYGAVYYDARGMPWVYVVTAPLTYERQRVGVDRVVGDVAVLSDGPPVGTPVVTVGAAMLFGTEVFGK